MRNGLRTMVVGSTALALAFVGCSAAGQSENQEKRDIVVIGGGIAGLTATHLLKDENVLLLEKEPVGGGRTTSGIHGAFHYAKGTEYLGSPDKNLAKLLTDLNITLKEIPSPMDAHFDGKSTYLGSEQIGQYLVANSDPKTYQRFKKLITDAAEKYEEVPDLKYDETAKHLDGISAEQWLRENDIPDVFIKKYNVASKGLFGATLAEISALSFIPEARFDYDEESAAPGEDVPTSIDPSEKPDPTDDRSGSYSLEKGITELTGKIEAELGNKVRHESTVTRVEKSGEIYKVTYTDKEPSEHTILADKVILAVPAPVALKIAPDALSPEKKAIMETVKYASYATVALYSNEPIFNQAFDLSVPDDYYFTDVYDATWVERHYSPEKRDLKEYIASVYVAPKNGADHSLDTISEKELLNNVYTDLEKITPGASNKVTGHDVQKFPYAYPIMSTGAYGRLSKLNELNTGSLVLAGDYMIYPTFEAAVDSAYLAVEKIKDR